MPCPELPRADHPTTLQQEHVPRITECAGGVETLLDALLASELGHACGLVVCQCAVLAGGAGLTTPKGAREVVEADGRVVMVDMTRSVNGAGRWTCRDAKCERWENAKSKSTTRQTCWEARDRGTAVGKPRSVLVLIAKQGCAGSHAARAPLQV